MSSMIDSIIELQRFKKPLEICIEGNGVFLAFCKGNIDIDVFVHLEQRTVKFANTLFASKLKQNLLSIIAESVKESGTEC